MLLPPPLYLPLLKKNPLSPFNAALMPMKTKHHPMEHEQPITGHTAEKTAPSSFRIYQLSIALAARRELMIDFLRWGLSTQPGLALNSCFSRLSLLSAKMAFLPVLVLSEEADLCSAKPLSGLYSMACKAAKRKDKVSRLLTALDSADALRTHGDFELSLGDWAQDVPEERERLLIFCAAFSPASVVLRTG